MSMSTTGRIRVSDGNLVWILELFAIGCIVGTLRFQSSSIVKILFSVLT